MYDESPLTFPKRADKDRLDLYTHFDRLYFGDHYAAFAIRGEKDFTERYKKLRYVVANFAGLMSRVMADMLFGENLGVDAADKNNQGFLDGLFEDNELQNQLYESALGSSRRGDALFKVRVGQRNPALVSSPSTIIIEEVTPAIYFPQLDQMATRNVPTQDVLAMVFAQNGKEYLHKEIHVPGYIFHEVYLYDSKQQKILGTMDPLQFGYQPMEETGIERSLVFHIPNVRDGSGFFGTSDYKDLDPLFFALNNRLTKVDNILDKHSDPILAVPPGVIDEEGKVKKEALGMFEVDNENPGFNKPEYIVWNANLDSAFKEIDKLVQMLFMFSEIAPASMGADEGSGGQLQSGRALKFKLLSTIRKRNRKLRYFDQAIKDMLETAQELAVVHGVEIDGFKPTTPERPALKWGDGVINDEVEMTDVQIARVDAGLSSRADAIAELDDVSPDDAKKKVKEIDKESEPTLPTIPGNAPTVPAPNAPQNGAPAGSQPPQVPQPAGR